MNSYRFNNLKIKHDGKEYLVYATVNYSIETDPETGAEAVFESAVVDEAIGFSGRITDAQTLAGLELPVLSVLNNDAHIARTVAARSGR